MANTPENDNSAELHNHSVLADDDRQESHSAANSPHIEVPVGMAVQENQPDELQTERSGTERVSITEDVAAMDQNVEVDDNDNIPERQWNAMEKQEEAADAVITSMSVQVRSAVQMAEQTSVACGEGELSLSAQNIHSESNIKSSSPIFQYSSDAAATVRFSLLPSQQVATQRCILNQTVAELRHQFAVEMKMADELIHILFDGKLVNENYTLGDLGVVPNGTIQLQLQSTDPANHPLQLIRSRQEYHMPDVITVRIHIDSVQYRDVVVEIERATSKKPFLGGYRHKQTGVEYHHATAQTTTRSRPQSAVQRFCRDTQTTQQRHARQQTANATSTQMTQIGTYVSSQQDRLVQPRPYTSADERHRTITDKVITIQKYYRRWLAKKYVSGVRENVQKRRDWELQEELNKQQEKENRIQQEFERRMNPKSKEDFDLLFRALEKWRKEELMRIDETLSGAERKAALCMLLDQETQLLASIGRHKLQADAQNREKFVQEFLQQTSAPKKWTTKDGRNIELDTPQTLRARQLRDLYNSINMKHMTQDERLDVLLTLKHTVKEHDCKLTKEIIELIDREADLLIRGVKDSNLDGLRKRISILFLQYVKTPSFNPEAAKFLRVPQDPTTLRKNIYYCKSCSQYLPATEFQLATSSKAVSRCLQCCKKTNEAVIRQEHTQFTYILQNVCRMEDTFGDDSKIAFLMQEKDIRYLVEKVWESQSILSAWDDLYDLVLVRWNCQEEWSPWNCILLTKDEASAHEKITSLEEAYGTVFLHRVKHKHAMAKNYFFHLPSLTEHLQIGQMSGNSSATSSAGRSLSGQSYRVAQLSAS